MSMRSVSPVSCHGRTIGCGEVIQHRNFGRIFPMHVLPIETALAMSHIEPFEVLLHRGELVEWSYGAGPVIFVSHQWLSTEHPDPSGLLWRVFLELLSAIVTGQADFSSWWLWELENSSIWISRDDLQESLREGFVWFDYACAPQNDFVEMARAINALPLYVADCAAFLVLAPPAVHVDDGRRRDRGSWHRRGWCRLEALANVLSPEPKHNLVLESASLKYISSLSTGWYANPPGLGDFERATDRDRIGPVIRRVIEARQETAYDYTDMVLFRFLEAVKLPLLAGTSAGVPREEDTGSLSEWSGSMHFRSVAMDEQKSGGWTPLRFALYGGRVDIGTELLQRGALAQVAIAEGHGRPDLGHPVGMSILHGLCLVLDSADGVSLLLRRRASPSSRDGSGLTAMHLAVVHGHTANLDALGRLAPAAVAAAAVPGANGEKTPWLFAAAIGERKAWLQLSQQTGGLKAEPNYTDFFGCGLATVVVENSGDVDTLRAVLEAGYDPNRCSEPSATSTKAQCVASQAACYMRESPTTVNEVLANRPNGTALGSAAYLGLTAAVQLLLEYSANPRLVNCYGRTPLMLAAMRGHWRCAILLVGAAADALETEDTWGRTAERWAERRGHKRLAQWLGSQREQVPVLGSCGCRDGTPTFCCVTDGGKEVTQHPWQWHAEATDEDASVLERALELPGGGTWSEAPGFAAPRGDGVPQVLPAGDTAADQPPVEASLGDASGDRTDDGASAAARPPKPTAAEERVEGSEVVFLGV